MSTGCHTPSRCTLILGMARGSLNGGKGRYIWAVFVPSRVNIFTTASVRVGGMFGLALGRGLLPITWKMFAYFPSFFVFMFVLFLGPNVK